MTAVSLMAVNVFLQNAPRTYRIATEILSNHIVGEDVFFKVLDEIVIWGFSIGFLVLIWFGINWARWLNLALTILNFALMFYRTAKLLAVHSSAFVYPISYVVLEGVALYLLFLSPGKVWFERARNPSSV